MKTVLFFIFIGLGISTDLNAEPWEFGWKCSEIYHPQLTKEEILSNLRAVIEAHAKEKYICL